MIHPVKAEVKKIESFSGHGDYKEMISFISCQDKKALNRIFIVHGEYDTQKKYISHLTEEGFRNIEAPAKGQEYVL
jgi:metallo-beta-lactamase family protein